MKNILLLLIEIPLACLSFIFYKLAKFIIGNLYTIYLARDRTIGFRWRVLSAETLASPLSLPVLMTKGPRWNTHAIIGTLGPFTVDRSIELDLVSARNSSRSWIAILYDFPHYKTIDTIESEQIDPNVKWQELKLKPGKYTIGLRYYHSLDKITLPVVKIDGQELVKSQNVAINVNDYYLSLYQKSNWFYLCLHYYIFTILKLRKYLPESFVKNEYLPVGATDTIFAYDYLAKQKKLTIEFSEFLFDCYDVYFTCYNRSSFPIFWTKITENPFTYQNNDLDLSYLIRIRDRTSSVTNSWSNISIEYSYDRDIQILKIN